MHRSIDRSIISSNETSTDSLRPLYPIPIDIFPGLTIINMFCSFPQIFSQSFDYWSCDITMLSRSSSIYPQNQYF